MDIDQVRSFLNGLSTTPRSLESIPKTSISKLPSRPLLNPPYQPPPMTIQLKQIGKPAMSLDVSLFDYIYSIKLEISKKLNVPWKSIRLLVKGKPLSDWKCVAEYPLAENTINIMIKNDSSLGQESKTDLKSVVDVPDTKMQIEKEASELSKKCQDETFWKDLQRVCLEHFSETQAKDVFDSIKNHLLNKI